MKAHSKARTVLLIAATLSLPLAAAAANAHPKHERDVIDRGYDYGFGHINGPYRSKHMPRRLSHDKRFRRWYRHSAIRHNPYLPWWKVYRVYERQMALRHYRHHDRLKRYGNHRRFNDHDDYHGDDWPRRRKPS